MTDDLSPKRLFAKNSRFDAIAKSRRSVCLTLSVPLARLPMTEFSTLLLQGNAWLFIPSAILLGALHGLEPGHSKTMMAAFIIAVRGTIGQAVLLGFAATLSHTAVVWLIALGGLTRPSQCYEMRNMAEALPK